MSQEQEPRCIQEASEVVSSTGFDMEYPETVNAVNLILTEEEYKPFGVLLRRREVSNMLHRLVIMRDFYINEGFRQSTDGGIDLEEDSLSVLISQFTESIKRDGKEIVLDTDTASIKHLQELFTSKEFGFESLRAKGETLRTIKKIKNQKYRIVKRKNASSKI